MKVEVSFTDDADFAEGPLESEVYPATGTVVGAAAVTVTPTALRLVEGGTGVYTVVLDAAPSDTVTITIGGTAGTDVSVDQPTLEFTATDWSTAQTVTVSTDADADTDNDEVTLTHTPTGGDYDGTTVASVAVTVLEGLELKAQPRSRGSNGRGGRQGEGNAEDRALGRAGGDGGLPRADGRRNGECRG